MKKRNKLYEIARGASLGLGMVPGVSAGTVAVVVGIYNDLINSLANIRKDFRKSWSTLWPVLIGAMIASALILIAVRYSYDKAPFLISCIFGGFIAGTYPIVSKDWRGKTKTVSEVLLIVVGCLIASSLGIGSALIKLFGNVSGVEAGFISGAWWAYLACIGAGLIAAIACIIPGISGALILFIVGLYKPLVGIYSGPDSMFHNHARAGSGICLTLCVAIGVIIGFLAASKGMKKSIEKHPKGTSLIVMGFVLGSIFSLFMNESFVQVNPDNTKVWAYETTPVWEYSLGILSFIVVFVVFLYLSRKHLNKSTNEQIY